MAVHRALVKSAGKTRQLPSGDRLADQPREYQQAGAPTGDRLGGDRWLNTETGARATWVVTASGGQWVGDDPGAIAQQFNGDIEITEIGRGVILRSPNGTRWRVTVDNSGTLVRTSL
jgi:hypothetical protein